MVKAIYTPRLNSNDDSVKISAIFKSLGDNVAIGDIVALVETSKVSVEVEADVSGVILRVDHQLDEHAIVGSPLVWIGEPGEVIPENEPKNADTPAEERSATLKAFAVMELYNLSIESFSHIEGIIREKDVMTFIQEQGCVMTRTPMSESQLAMQETLSWQNVSARPTYVEVLYDQMAWAKYSKQEGARMNLLVDPQFLLLSYQLIQQAKKNENINSHVEEDEIVFSPQINLGFTMQVKEKLLLLVLHDAGKFYFEDFCHHMLDLQKRALNGDVSSHELNGATIAISSLSRLGVSRHIPLLPPKTSLMIGHTSYKLPSLEIECEIGVLGASYDHRLLTGHDVATILKKLTKNN